MRSHVWVSAFVIGAALALTACATDGSGSSTQLLTPSGTAPAPTSRCDAASLGPGDRAPWDVRRGSVEGEPSGKTYVTAFVQVRVTLSCTGGDWQFAMAPSGGEWLPLPHAGEAGPFGPYTKGQILTFSLTWPEGADPEATVPGHVLINGVEIGVQARSWSQVDTTWAGPTLGEPTMTFPPPAS